MLIDVTPFGSAKRIYISDQSRNGTIIEGEEISLEELLTGVESLQIDVARITDTLQAKITTTPLTPD